MVGSAFHFVPPPPLLEGGEEVCGDGVAAPGRTARAQPPQVFCGKYTGFFDTARLTVVVDPGLDGSDRPVEMAPADLEARAGK